MTLLKGMVLIKKKQISQFFNLSINSYYSTRKKKKIKNNVKSIGKLYINIKPNNIFFTLTDKKNKVLFSISTGLAGFKKARRSSLYAVEITTEFLIKKLKYNNLNKIYLYIKGVNRKKRKTCIKLLKRAKFIFVKIKDITPIAHGSCRQKKLRRL
uniref:Ribosomal protein S11 n=1 Tax=Cyanophora biloba TaxID=1489483 RepID=A0A873WYD1_9EUKA|nr:ribosomal protein S11 [Cyanophora biloba]QPB15021.1 ribosomal protein S11 [Cyanophora biloba]